MGLYRLPSVHDRIPVTFSHQVQSVSRGAISSGIQLSTVTPYYFLITEYYRIVTHNYLDETQYYSVG